jgi:hypothetical protein
MIFIDCIIRAISKNLMVQEKIQKITKSIIYKRRYIIMAYCCKHSNGDLKELRVTKFDGIKQIITERNIPFTCNNNDLMVCSPVGNQVKFKKFKADLVLSGYCTAPDAAIRYLKDERIDEFLDCRHSFDTANMKAGVIKLLETIGFNNGQRIYQDTLNPNFMSPNINLLFTQMLCMISPNGGSEAKAVEKLLKNTEKSIFLQQANDSLTSWYKKICQNAKVNGTIVLMGDQAYNLLSNASVSENGDVYIDFIRKHNKPLLLEVLEQHYCIFSVYHASSLRRNNLLEKWNKNERRKKVYQHLISKFPGIPEINYSLENN